MNEQLMVTIAAGPVLSLVVVISGYIVQNANLNARMIEVNARMAEMNSRMSELKADLRELMNANTATLRAEIAKSHSEMLLKFAETRSARGQA